MNTLKFLKVKWWGIATILFLSGLFLRGEENFIGNAQQPNPILKKNRWFFRSEYFSKYLDRGRQQGGKGFKTQLEGQWFCSENYFFGGMECFIPKKSTHRESFYAYAQDLASYAGYAFNLSDDFYCRVGAKFHRFNRRKKYRHTEEVFIGVEGGIELKPSVYFYYDVAQRQLCVESSMAYTFDLSDFVPKTFLAVMVQWGYLNAHRLHGLELNYQRKKAHYFYLGSHLQLSYKLTENFSLFSRVTWVKNSNKRRGFANFWRHKSGASVVCLGIEGKW